MVKESFWLLIFLFGNGEFNKKVEIEYISKAHCERAMAKKQKMAPRSVMFCVSDGHYRGKKIDRNIPLDFH